MERSFTLHKSFMDMVSQPHLLIAGATGSGKSVLLHNLIYHLLGTLHGHKAPNLYLIDPKRVELIDYAGLPQTAMHATEPADIIRTLESVVRLMDGRYRSMMERPNPTERKFYGEPAVYVIIDELADIMTTSKKQVTPLLARLTQLGRAANVHVIAATQRPTRDLINGQIAVNIDARVALRCPTAQDSRNIIGVAGAENLPRYGSCIYRNPDGITRYTVPRIPPEEIQAAVEWLIAGRSSRSRHEREYVRVGGTLRRGEDLRDLDQPQWLRALKRMFVKR